MKKTVKEYIKAYLAERPSVHIGMNWDSEGFIFVAQNSGDVYAILVPRSKVLTACGLLTVKGEDCSLKSGGGWHLRVNGATALYFWAVENLTNGKTEKKGVIEKLCSVEEWTDKIAQYQAMHHEKAKNAGRTAEWVCGEHFEGSTLNQHNDRKNDNESDIILADGTHWEIKCIALTSRAQIKVQD